MTVRVGRYGESGDAGWTEITPHASNSKCVYVNPSIGNDSNAGTDPSAPLATLAAAHSKTGGGPGNRKPDWILIAEGEVLEGSGATLWGGTGLINKGGTSGNDPFVLTSYNPNLVGITAGTPRGTQRSAPPTIRLSDSFIGVNNSDQMPYFAMIGLDFHGYMCDPIHNPSEYVIATASPHACDFLYNCKWILVEDVHCQAACMDFGSVHPNAKGDCGVRIMRRNSVRNFTGIGTHSVQSPYSLLEESYFDHNGWCKNLPQNNSDQLARDGNNHNAYFNSVSNFPATFIQRGNLSHEGSFAGLRCRQGGQVYDNLCIQDGWGIETGGGTGFTPTYDATLQLGGNPYRIFDNVILDTYSDSVAGGGIGIRLVRYPQGCTVSRNLIARRTGTGNLAQAAGISYESAYNHTIGSDNVVVGFSANQALSATNGSGVTTTTDTGVITSTTGMSHPTWGIAEYATQHLGLADEAAFWTNKRAMRRYNWDERYQPWYINNVIRGWYNMATTVDNRPTYKASGALSGRLLKA